LHGYLLAEDEYLKYRYANLEYNIELMAYHSESYHQESRIGSFFDEVEEHKDLIKFLLPFVFGI